MCKLKVLSVGSESARLVRDAVALQPGSRLWVATSYWDLCSLSLQNHGELQVAVLDASPSPSELRRRVEYIRRRWPDTAIVLVADSCMVLDDPLYDERVPSAIEPADLLGVIDELGSRGAPQHRGRLRHQR